jgi:hypothetical protein
MYIFTGHDEDNSTTYDMHDWHAFSSADMANWRHHGAVMTLDTFTWADANAWAGQVVERNGLFYYYVPVRNAATQGMAIGVAVSEGGVTGPYVDAIGGPLVENGQIDPTVFVDDDGQAYMYWGNPDLWYVALNDDMMSYSGNITQVELTAESFGPRYDNPDRATAFEEAPWPYKRDDLYYMVYAGICCPEDIRYSTGPTATGPWTYRGVIMPYEGGSFTNHPGIVDFMGRSYFVYHNGALPGGGGFTRSVAVESFVYNADGSIPAIAMTAEGPAQVESLDPYVRQQAETIASSEGIETEECSACGDGRLNIWSINNGDYIKVKGMAFGDEPGPTSFTASVASDLDGGRIELRLDSETGPVVGTCTVPHTGGWQVWTAVSCPVSGATGTRDLVFRFTGEGSLDLFNFDWWQFAR